MTLSRSLFASASIAAMLALLGLAACAPAATPTSPPTPQTGAAVPTWTPGGAADAAVRIARVQGFGLFLTDNAGRTLYANANDSKDTITCTGSCSQNWPPFIAQTTPEAPSNINPSLLTTFKRPDGMSQVEYDSHPLYYYAGDKNPNDVKGQGVGNVWHVLSPRGNPMLNPYSPAPTATP